MSVLKWLDDEQASGPATLSKVSHVRVRLLACRMTKKTMRKKEKSRVKRFEGTKSVVGRDLLFEWCVEGYFVGTIGSNE